MRFPAFILAALVGVSFQAAGQSIAAPPNTLDAKSSDDLESKLDAFFAEPQSFNRKSIYEEQLKDAPVGLSFEELEAMHEAKPPSGEMRFNMAYRVKDAVRDDPRGYFNIALPEGYTPKRAWPLVVALHGRGGNADHLVVVTAPVLAKAGYFVVYPTTADVKLNWSSADESANLYRAIDFVARRYRIDFRKMFITGGSMGGMGTWSHVQGFPEVWAGGAPIAGHPGIAPGPWMARLRGIGLYIVHGEKDTVVPVQPTRVMVQALKKGKYKHTYVELPGVNHGVPRDAWRDMCVWISKQPAKDYSSRPMFLPTERGRPLWQGVLDPVGLEDEKDPIVELLRAGDYNAAALEIRKQMIRRRGDARLYVLRAIAAVPPLLDPTPEAFDVAAMRDRPGGWGERAETSALGSLRLALNSKVGKGPATRRFDAEVTHLIARIWAKRFAVSVDDGKGRAWVTRYNSFARYAGQTQQLQPGHSGTNRLIQAANALLPGAGKQR